LASDASFLGYPFICIESEIKFMMHC